MQRGGGQVEPVRPGPGPGGEAPFEGVLDHLGRHGQADQALAQRRCLIEAEAAFALGDRLGRGDGLVPGGRAGIQQAVLVLADLALADRQQLAEPAVGGPVARVDDQLGPVGELQPAADQQAEALVPGLGVGPHHPGQAVAVRHPQRRQPQPRRLDHQLPRVRRPLQEAEIGPRIEFGVGGHRRKGEGEGARSSSPLPSGEERRVIRNLPERSPPHANTPCSHQVGGRAPSSRP